MNLNLYKKGQGMISRIAAWIFISAFALFGCISLYLFIPTEDYTKDPPQSTFWGTKLLTIPFFDVTIVLGLIISIVLFLLTVFVIYLFVVNRPANADYLIETEYELRKVSWPPRYEYWGSSLAVIVSVVIMGLFLVIIDTAWSWIMTLIKIH